MTARGAVTASTSTAEAAVATAPSADDGSGYDGSSSEGDVDLSAEPLVDGDLAPSGQAASAADPPGYVREEHTSAPGGRVYSVWLAPTGERFRSRRLAWAHAMLRGPRAGAGASPASAVLSPACLDCESDGGGSDGSDGAGAPSPPPASARAVTRGAQRASTAPRPPRSRHSFAYVPIDDTQCMTTGCTVPATDVGGLAITRQAGPGVRIQTLRTPVLTLMHAPRLNSAAHRLATWRAKGRILATCSCNVAYSFKARRYKVRVIKVRVRRLNSRPGATGIRSTADTRA